MDGLIHTDSKVSSLNAAGVVPHRQLADVGEQQGVNQIDIGLKQGLTTATTTIPLTTPAIQCGLGPATMPAARSSISERLAGGVNAKKNAWPFTVLVAISIGLGQQPCSGVLISDTKVLLAAQCLERLPLFYTMLMTVSVGMHSINPFDAPMTRRVSNIVLHGQFNAATFANDIAIITLDAPVVLSRTVAPVCLPPASADPDQYVDQDAIVLGRDAENWGQVVAAFISIASNSAAVLYTVL
ncbi:chymotrypsin-like elastase family member 2A [Daphnia pulicaria]|uniref:chymotrypsin-like elastase family member 2A n=1 Tax=Daphnia pulicaria TaxID=35523 RepID=UPI001EEA4015|nr:chymotrypsin-like elastase family member 2A [Daphnia pulicaria]